VTALARMQCPHARRGDRVGQARLTRSRRAPRPRRTRELLDADVHQLAAPGAVRALVVTGLSRRLCTEGGQLRVSYATGARWRREGSHRGPRTALVPAPDPSVAAAPTPWASTPR